MAQRLIKNHDSRERACQIILSTAPTSKSFQCDSYWRADGRQGVGFERTGALQMCLSSPPDTDWLAPLASRVRPFRLCACVRLVGRLRHGGLLRGWRLRLIEA